MTPCQPRPRIHFLYYCLLTFHLLSPATTRHLPQNRRSSPSPPPAPCAGRQPAGEGRRRADPFPSLPPRDLFLLSPVLSLTTTTTTVINKSAGRQARAQARGARRPRPSSTCRLRLACSRLQETAATPASLQHTTAQVATARPPGSRRFPFPFRFSPLPPQAARGPPGRPAGFVPRAGRATTRALGFRSPPESFGSAWRRGAAADRRVLLLQFPARRKGRTASGPRAPRR